MIATLTPEIAAPLHPQWYSYLDRRIPPPFDPDKRVFEVLNGTEVEKFMGAWETILANTIYRHLFPFVEAQSLGQCYIGMEIELPIVKARRKPDVCFISTDTWPIDRQFPDEAWWPVVPDLTVEVISPYELTHATIAKLNEYFAAGVKLAWLVYPNVEHVYCYTSPTEVRILTRSDTLTGDPVIPGFRMPLADLFPPAVPVPATQ